MKKKQCEHSYTYTDYGWTICAACKQYLYALRTRFDKLNVESIQTLLNQLEDLNK